MKKVFLTAMIASLLIVPLGNTALADHEEEAAPAAVQTFLPGDVPAETTAAESMLPAVHGVVLALLNHDTAAFDPSDSALAWEGLYNMLSLYGQMDERCDLRSGELALPEEEVWDYAAALGIGRDSLSPLPAGLADRIRYDSSSYSYLVICGDADLVELELDSLQTQDGCVVLTGSLVYPPDGEVLARFQARLQPRDNVFGFALTALTVS